MQVSVETTGGLERRLKISVEAESFEDQITTKLKETSKRIRLPGFRPGKVPLKEVRRRFGPAVRQEVAQEVMQSSYVEAVQQEELTPAGAPELEVLNIDLGADLEFTATFEVFPSVELGDFGQVSVKRPDGGITDGDVDQMIERLREQRKEWLETDQPAAQDDRLTVDFLGKIDGEPFEGGKGEDVEIVIGSGQMIPDLENGIVGIKAGDEKTVPVTFPEDYHAENLKGQDAQFDVVAKKVEQPHLPELDDEFFTAFGVEEGSGEDAFRAEIRDNMTSEMNAAAHGQVKRQVLDELARLHEFSIPKALVERESDVLRNQMLQQLQMPASAEQPALPSELFADEAEKRVRVGLVVNEIVSAEQLEADADKVRARIEELAKPYDQPDQIVNWYYSNEQQLQQVEFAVLEDTVVDHVLIHAAVDVIDSSYDDIITGRATAPPEPEPADDPTPSDEVTSATPSDEVTSATPSDEVTSATPSDEVTSGNLPSDDEAPSDDGGGEVVSEEPKD